MKNLTTLKSVLTKSIKVPVITLALGLAFVLCLTSGIMINRGNFAFNENITAAPQLGTETAAYKKELSEKIIKAGTGQLSFIFQIYRKLGNREFMLTEVRGKELNAYMWFELSRPMAKLDGIKRTKGVGYRGAHLKGVNLALPQTPEGYFRLQGIDYIAD